MGIATVVQKSLLRMKEKQMRKSTSLIFAGLLAGSLILPMGRGYADDDDRPRNRREDLRRDEQQLEHLRRQRRHEIHEGDRDEAREYNEKIRDLREDIHRDRRALRDKRHDRDRDHDHDHD